MNTSQRKTKLFLSGARLRVNIDPMCVILTHTGVDVEEKIPFAAICFSLSPSPCLSLSLACTGGVSC